MQNRLIIYKFMFKVCVITNHHPPQAQSQSPSPA